MPKRLTPAGIALLYAVFAALWIVASGALLTFAVDDPLLQGRIELAKGLGFVAVTSGLLYLLLKVWREPVGGATTVSDDDIRPPETTRLVLLFIALVLLVPLIGLAIVKLHGPQIEREAYANLESVALLKAGQIENWLVDRYNDNVVLAADEAFAVRVDQLVHQTRDANLSKAVLDRLDTLRTTYGYASILLLDAGSRLLLASGEHADMHPELEKLLRLSPAGKKVRRSDLYRDESGRVRLEWVVPMVITGPQDKRVAAVVVLRVAPERFLYPLIQTWPTTSPSAETLLVRREGESILFLNELRHRKGAALTLKYSLTDPTLPAALAYREAKPGTISGIDYRGVPVLAAYRPVAGTGWHIIAKVDRDEVLAPLWDMVLWISLVAFVAVVAICVALLLLWRQQRRAQSLALLARSAAVIEQSERHFRAVVQSAKDAIVTADSTGNIVRWNPGAERMFGYMEAEINGQSLTRLMPERFYDRHREGLAKVAAGGEPRIIGKSVEFAGQRKDGSEFPLELSLAQWETTTSRFFTATIRDLTGRKAAEAKIQRLTRLYAALSQCNEAIVRCESAAELFPQICRDAVHFGGMKMAWIGLLDAAGQQVQPVAAYGEGMEYLDGLRISMDAGDPSGRGPAGTAMRENQPYWCQDFQNDPVTAPWHARGARSGWGASAALPLHRNGAVIGAFNLLAGETNAFDEAERNLLVEMAVDISYALNRFAFEEERKQAELALRESEARFRSLTEMSSDFYWESDAEHRLTARGAANRKKSAVPVFRQGAQIGERRWEIPYLSPDEAGWRAHRAALDAHLPFRNFEISCLGVDGAERHISISGDPVFDVSGAFKGYRGVGTDITERKAAEQRIEHLAQYDLLTDLPNRLLLNDRVAVAVAHAARHDGRLALLYVDLDKFKFINDTLGHAVGDQLLKAVAMRIASAIRASDAASRVGGDEFVVLLNEINAAEDAARIAEKIIRDVSAPYRLDEHELVLTASIGIVIFPENGQDADALLRRAETAMFAAKDGGRNRYQFYSEAMGVRAAERLHLETDLRGASARGEIFVVYQPQTELARGRVIGAEALARWRHPRHGLISPLRFIPVAEESGLIIEIGEWILREACRQARDWRDRDILDACVSVNVSAVQFRQAGFIEVVKRALDESGLSPANLELEVTESVVMEGITTVLDILRRLDALGVRLAIDDFGTGYSSLSYLRQFPTQRLKIDQSFVRDLPADPDAAAIVRAIVSMGRSLGMDLIAEGVENEAQAEFLRGIGCEEAQGYLYAKPMTASEFEAWVAAWKAR